MSISQPFIQAFNDVGLGSDTFWWVCACSLCLRRALHKQEAGVSFASEINMKYDDCTCWYSWGRCLLAFIGFSSACQEISIAGLPAIVSSSLKWKETVVFKSSYSFSSHTGTKSCHCSHHVPSGNCWVNTLALNHINRSKEMCRPITIS